MSENVDLTFLKHRIAELEDSHLLPAPEEPNPRLMAVGENRAQAGREIHLTAIRADLHYLRRGIATLDGATAALREHITTLPSKGFIVATSLISICVIAALVTFQGAIQAALKTIH